MRSGTAEGCAVDLEELVRRLSGCIADVRTVALDDQNGKLHVPLVHPSRGLRAKLLIAHVNDLVVERNGRIRRFGFDGLAYDPATRRLTLVDVPGLRLVVGVEHLELGLRAN